MDTSHEFAVVVDHGVLRPESQINLPDNTRLVVTIRRIDTTPQAEADGREALRRIRERGEIRLGGWHPRREELHERD